MEHQEDRQSCDHGGREYQLDQIEPPVNYSKRLQRDAAEKGVHSDHDVDGSKVLEKLIVNHN